MKDTYDLKKTIRRHIEDIFLCRFSADNIDDMVSELFKTNDFVDVEGANIRYIKKLFNQMDLVNNYSLEIINGTEYCYFPAEDRIKLRELLTDVPSMKCVYATYLKAYALIMDKCDINIKSVAVETSFSNNMADPIKESVERGYGIDQIGDTLWMTNNTVGFQIVDFPEKDDNFGSWQVWTDKSSELIALRDYVLREILMNPFRNRFEEEEMFPFLCKFGYLSYTIVFEDDSRVKFMTTESGFDLFGIIRDVLLDSIPPDFEGPFGLIN
ncbi:MAG: hypothetical protein MJ238_04765 [Bacilli bacterium]|nr:hypothetical protein [Bacilli bacterium]